MSVSGDSFQKFADWLQTQDSCNDEIKFRSCVNRAYYSIFHTTKAALFKKFLLRNQKANHRDVIERLKLEDEFLGNKLYNFFNERKRADYDLNIDLSPKKAERLVKEMKKFSQELNDSDSMIEINKL